jgi:3-deoxy-D-manno-octulosonic-acid transferase
MGIYTLGVRIFVWLLSLFSRWKPSWRKFYQSRKDTEKSLLSIPEKKSSKRVWMHCASLGEYEQGKPIFQQIRNHFPDCELFLTFFSSSGYESCHKDPLLDGVFYLPFDLPKPVAFFLDSLQPDLAIFVKYDVWPLVILKAKSRGIPLYLVSALVKERAWYLRSYALILHKAYRAFDHIFTQDMASLLLLQKSGFASVSVAGDTRIDRVLSLREQAWSLPKLEEWIGNRPLFILGSTHAGKDDEMTVKCIEILRSRGEDWRFLVFPHHVDPFRVEALQKLLGGEVALYSQSLWEGDLLLVDAMGLLSKTYRWARGAYIGGAFEGSAHNLLEPGVYGIPLICGPKPGHFAEVKKFLSSQILHAVAGAEELEAVLPEILEKGAHCQRELNHFFEKESGGTLRVFDRLKPYLGL